MSAIYEGNKLILTFPMPPNIANSRWHWRSKQAKKAHWFGVIDILHRPHDDPPMEKALIAADFYLWNKMDYDNLFARLKWPLDWLTLNSYIVDDNPDVLKWETMPTQQIDRKNQRLVITLEPQDG
jgi:hypothetical protein